MRVAIATLLATAAMTTAAFAANGAATAEPGILCWGFIGLCAAVLVGQVAPAIGVFTGLAIPPRETNRR